MGLFDRGDSYRLRDPELGRRREKKKREIRRYQPPKPLSWLSCGILAAFSLALFAYAAYTLYWHFAGTETAALAYTALDGDGNVVEDNGYAMSTVLPYTYRDAAGVLYAATDSLTGYSGTVGETIAVRYLPGNPAKSHLAFRFDSLLTPAGCLLLGVFLLATAVTRLREIFGKAAPAQEQKPEAK